MPRPSDVAPGKIRVLVADPIPLFSEALAGMLAQQRDFVVIGDRPARGIDAVEAILAYRPDVTLLDYWMEDMEGAAATHLVVSRQPDRKIIIMSWFHGTKEIEDSLNAGAVGFFPKTIKLQQVVDGIRRAQEGESPVYLSQLEQMFRNISNRTGRSAEILRKLAGLTRRELEILALLSLGHSPKEVAKMLSLSYATVRVHLRNMTEKAGTHSYADLVTMARACGLVRT